MANLQGITIAIAPSGLQYLTRQILLPPIQHALASLTPTMAPLSLGNISVDVGHYSSATAENTVVTLTSGRLNGFDMTFVSLTQDDNSKGQFTLVLNNAGKPFSASFNWNEQYYWCWQDMGGPCVGNSGPYNYNWPYTIGFSEMTLTMVYQFEYKGNAWQVTPISSTPTPGTVSPNIPGASMVLYQEKGWCGTTVSDATKNSVDTIDFASAIAAAMKPLVSSIPATGQITADIRFQFEEAGPDGLTFPGTGGILAGVTGVALYKGTAYSGPNPPTVSMPSMPADKMLAYNVSDYTFNSLMWAFYTEGNLKRYVVPGDLPDPAVLNTSTYQNSPLQALYDAYPDLDMTANIVAKAAPAVAFKQIYNLTDAGYAGLKSPLPPDVYTKLKTVKGRAFLTELSFSQELTNVLGEEPADKYKTIIEAAALVRAGVVTHDNQVVLNVVQDGNQIPVITFDVAETDVLQDFALGISGAAQTLGFAFQIIPDLTKTTFISSSIAGIDSGDFSYIWNLALRLAYAKEMAKIGKAGVALPRIPNFDFLFSEAVITLQDGYANVVTDVVHTSDAGRVMYLASKILPRRRGGAAHA